MAFFKWLAKNSVLPYNLYKYKHKYKYMHYSLYISLKWVTMHNVELKTSTILG